MEDIGGRFLRLDLGVLDLGVLDLMVDRAGDRLEASASPDKDDTILDPN